MDLKTKEGAGSQPGSNPHLLKAKKLGLSFKNLDQIAKNAIAYCRRTFSFWGSLTKDDLYSQAWLGLISGLNQEKIEKCADVKQAQAYLFTFARGYCIHALHRQSRMIKFPWPKLKEASGHLSLDWGNLPQCESPEPNFSSPLNLLILADSISARDKKRLLAGEHSSRLSQKTNSIINQIRQQTSSLLTIPENNASCL